MSKFGWTFIIFLLHICYLSAEFGFWFWCKLALRVMLLENVKKMQCFFVSVFIWLLCIGSNEKFKNYVPWYIWFWNWCPWLFQLCVMPLKIYKITKQAIRITGNYFQVLFFIFISAGLRKWELYPRYLTFCVYFLLFVIFNFLTFYSSRELFNQSCWNQTCHSWSFQFRFKIAKKLIPCFCPTGE